MSTAKFTYQGIRSTITAAGINSPFDSLADATDGTLGRIDPSNTRTEAFNRNHIKGTGSPNISADELEALEVLYGNDPAQTGVFTDVWVQPVAFTVAQNEVLRVHFNPLVTLTVRNGTASVIVRAESAFYLQAYVTIAGVDTAIGAPFGYNSICAGDGNTGTNDNKTLFYERLPFSAIWMPNVSTAITNIKIKIYFDNATNFAVSMKFKYGLYVHHKY
jgi:hypothetical protein